MTDFNFSQYGAFFAFSDKRFQEQSTQGVKYVACGAGLYCPQDKVDEMIKDFKAFNKAQNEEKLAKKKSLIALIREQLFNYEITITQDVEQVIDLVFKEYKNIGATRRMVAKEAKAILCL